MKLTKREKVSYSFGAVGKDMAYMLSASYVLYYYQDVLGVSAVIMGIILLAARVFDAFNDPIMGMIVAKTKTRWGKFRPWLFVGSIVNAVILYLLFTAPIGLDGKGLVAYAAIIYILWGVTYTMMDIPFWSMIPAFTESGKEREQLSTLARSCSGVGSALAYCGAVFAVGLLAKTERVGYSRYALIIAVLFGLFEIIMCFTIKEKSTVEIESPSVGQMFKSLIRNDQALTVVAAIVLINCSLYITSNLLIYFFKYDVAGAGWKNAYTIFNVFGSGIQVLSMMLFFPFARKFLNTIQVFFLSVGMAIVGYGILLVLMCLGVHNLAVLCIPAFFVFAAFGMLTVLTTIFLANSVDYGEFKNHQRDESVIFSMQTFVVKLASGVAAFIASVCLSVSHISNNTDNVVVSAATGSSVMILRMTMTILPIIGVFIALLVFRKKYILTDEKLDEINTELKSRTEK